MKKLLVTILICVFECCKSDDVDSNTKCNDGWELCIASGECVPSECKGISSTSSSTPCGPGQTFCKEIQGCVPLCPVKTNALYQNMDNKVVERCEGELIYCVSTESCLPPLLCDDPLNYSPLRNCPEGTHLCYWSGQCEAEKCGSPPNQSSCPFGMVFCLQTSSCEEDCLMNSAGLNQAHKDTDFLTPYKSCSPGKVWCTESNDCESIQDCPSNLSSPKRSHRCRYGMLFCVRTGKCEPRELCGRPLLALSNIPCADGLIFCLTSNQCVPPEGCDTPSLSQMFKENSPKQCLQGMIFCVATGMCSPKESCDLAQSPLQFKPSPTAKRCRRGMIFCLTSNQCVPPEGCDTPSLSQMFKENPPKQCLQGMIFCVATGMCSPKESCDLAQSPLQFKPSPTAKRCRRGMIFCLTSNQCVPPEGCDTPTLSQMFKENPPKQCLQGMIFCVATGMCSPKESCDLAQSPLQFKPSPTAKRCRRGMIFCTELEKCVYKEECWGGVSYESFESPKQRSTHLCQEGEILCPSLGFCVKQNLCNQAKRFQAQSQNKNLICEMDKVFCLSSETCEEEGRCLSRSANDWGTMCPRDYVYCLERQECVFADITRPEVGSVLRCPTGMAFCAKKGQCSDECDSEIIMWTEPKCPITQGVYNYTSCIADSHCALGQTCCPDTETYHQQCIDSNEKSDENALELSCSSMLTTDTDDKTTDTGISCLIAEDCPPASICCNKKCRTPRGKKSCPAFTLFCDYSDSCVYVGEECGKVCMPGQILCSSPDGCMEDNQCETSPERNGGAPWMLPGPLLLTPDSYISRGETQLDYLFESSSSTNTKLEVKENHSTFGIFETKQTIDDKWQPLKVGSSFSTSDYIRFMPMEKVYTFGIAYLVVVEKDSQIERTIVQLLAPEPPEFKLEAMRDSIITLEDEEQRVSFKELFVIKDTDDKYWQARHNAMGLASKAAHLGLLDFTHPSTIDFVKRIIRLDIGIDEELDENIEMSSMNSNSQVRRGLRLEYQQESDDDDEEPILTIGVSVNNGKSYQTLSHTEGKLELLVSGPNSLRDTLLRIIPRANAYGNFTLLFTPIIKDFFSGGSVNGELSDSFITTKYNIVVLPVNDAPKALYSYDASADMPKISYENNLLEISAGKLASNYFEDVDGDFMGVAIFYAQNSDLGYWQYSTDSGLSYSIISDLNNEEYRPKMPDGSKYQGVLSNQNSNGKEVLASLMAPTSKTSETDDIKSKIEEERTVSALFLPKTALLQFVPKTGIWSVVKAMLHTRLGYRAWDTSNIDAENIEAHRMNISIVVGKKGCGKMDSLSEFPAVVIAEWSGCNGGISVDDTVEVIDKCGDCGGDNSSCTDCYGVIDGSATMVCCRCVGGTTGIDPDSVRDCVYSCNENDIATNEGEEVCYPKDEINKEDIPCDGVKGSTAKINECGICVGGNTRYEVDYINIDVCGICDGNNECVGCDSVINSLKVFDLCRNCLLRTDPFFNRDCRKLGYPRPSKIDASLLKVLTISDQIDLNDGEEVYKLQKELEPMTVRIAIAGISSEEYEVVSCNLIDTSSEEIIGSIMAEFSGETVTFIPEDLKEGNYSVACKLMSRKLNEVETTEEKNDEAEIEATSLGFLSIVDSSAVKIKKVDSESISSKDEKITITLEELVDTSGAICVLMYSPLSKEEMSTVIDLSQILPEIPTEKEIVCAIDSTLMPGNADLVILLSKSMLPYLKRKQMEFPSKGVLIEASAPLVVDANLSPTNEILTITFDKNIEFKDKCENSFDEKEILGGSPICQVLQSKLKIILGTNHQVINGTSLSFSVPSKIIQKHGPTNSPSASGNIKVFQKIEEDLFKFKIIGTITACNTSFIELEAMLNKIPEAEKYKVKWEVNGTWQMQSATSKEMNVLLWKSVQNIQEVIDVQQNDANTWDRILKFSGSLLLQGVKYTVKATLVDGPKESEIKVEKFNFKAIDSGENILVILKGPTKIYADQKYSYEVYLKSCDESINTEDADLNIIWHLSGDAKPFKPSRYMTERTIEPFSLKGDKKYKMTVLVQDNNGKAMGMGALEIMTLSKDVDVKLNFKRLQVGSTSSFTIDGSQTIDPDGNNKILSYRWECRLRDGSACYTEIDGVKKRFENAIKKEILLSAKITVDKSVLKPNHYIFTLWVTKKCITFSNQAEVTVVNGILPEIITKSPSVAIDVTKKNKILGFVSSDPVLEIGWSSVREDGFDFFDLVQKQTITDPSTRREFPLELPESGLKTGAQYKFRLSASANGGKVSQADVVVKTKTPPIGGEIEVTPDNGEALLTPFVFSALNWKDQDLPLSAWFGYKIKGTDYVVWSEKTNGPNLSSVLYFPSAENSVQIIPMAKICDSEGACSQVSHAEVTVNLPSENKLTSEIVLELGTNLANKLLDDTQTLGALYEFGNLVATLAAIGNQDQVNLMVAFVEDQTFKKVLELEQRIRNDPSARDAGNDVIKGTLENYKKGPFTLNSLTTLVLLKYMLMHSAYVTAKQDQAGKRTSTSSKIYYYEADFDAEVASKTQLLDSMTNNLKSVMLSEEYSEQNPRKLIRTKRSFSMENEDHFDTIYSRYRRETQSKTTESPLKARSKETVEDFIKVAETRIRNAQSQSSKSKAMNALVVEMDSYAGSLCIGMEVTSDPVEIYSQLVSLRVIKTQLMDEANKMLPIADADGDKDDFVDKTNFITFGASINQFKNWKCDPNNKEEPNCYGACIASMEFDKLFVSPTTVRVEEPSRKPLSHLIKTSLLHPTKGYEIKPDAGAPTLSYLMAVKKPSINGSVSRCYGWKEGEWSETACKNSFSKRTFPTNVKCSCKEPGFVSVFEIPPNSNEDDTDGPSSNDTYQSIVKKRTITIKLEGDYKESVENREEDFKKEIINQLVALVNKKLDTTYTPGNFEITHIRNGSIYVDLTITENEGQRMSGGAGSIDAVQEFLLSQIQNGNLIFEGLDDEILRAVSTSNAKEPSYLPILIGGIVGGLLLITVALVILAIYLNKKKRMDKVNPINGSLPPTYRAIHFEKSLDGTTGSLNKGKQFKDWQPESATYKGDGLIIERNSAGKSSRTDSGIGSPMNEDEVPEAFSYRTPSKEELDRSGPIPEHILKKISRDHLPGNPGKLH